MCWGVGIGEGQGMLWHGMENGMEWKENFGMEYGRCSEWNGRFEKWNGRSSSILTT